MLKKYYVYEEGRSSQDNLCVVSSLDRSLRVYKTRLTKSCFDALWCMSGQFEYKSSEKTEI